MGSLATTHRRGHIPTARTNFDPLRKVVQTGTDEHGVLCDLLDCGHKMHIRQDFIGVCYASRRRCRQCGREQGRESPYDPPPGYVEKPRKPYTYRGWRDKP